LWAAAENRRLSARARQVLADDENILYLSAVSGWKIATKYRIGKLPEAKLLMGDFSGTLRALGFVFIPMTVDHAYLAGSFTMTHKDPFDRLIAAQAKLEDLPLLSADPVFDEFPIRRIW